MQCDHGRLVIRCQINGQFFPGSFGWDIPTFPDKLHPYLNDLSDSLVKHEFPKTEKVSAIFEK